VKIVFNVLSDNRLQDRPMITRLTGRVNNLNVASHSSPTLNNFRYKIS